MRFFPFDKCKNKVKKTDKMFDYQNMTKGWLLFILNAIFSLLNSLYDKLTGQKWQTEVLPRHMNECSSLKSIERIVSLSVYDT